MIPQALNNYLLRLGWGYKDKEFFSKDEAVKLFNIKGIGKSPSRFDLVKLKSINTSYFKKLTSSEILNKLSIQYLDNNLRNLIPLIEVFKSRSECIKDIEEGLDYILSDNLDFYSSDASRLIKMADKCLLKNTISELEKIKNWNAKILEETIKELVKKYSIKIYDLAAPIRASITGKTYSPSIFLILELLGKKVSIERLKRNFLI